MPNPTLTLERHHRVESVFYKKTSDIPGNLYHLLEMVEAELIVETPESFKLKTPSLEI